MKRLEHALTLPGGSDIPPEEPAGYRPAEVLPPSAALGLALDPGVQARAKAVAATIRVDGATVASDLLVSSAAG
jgi:hypothetical protein